MKMCIPDTSRIQNLNDLPQETEDYVVKKVPKRLKCLRELPDDARKILEAGPARILDVGPGEGISSMALAQFAPRSAIVGVEMDIGHLPCAWPMCNQYQNLQLVWGTIPGTPSNPNVGYNPNRQAPAMDPPALELPDNYCDVLFSWIGMSRRDIFEQSGTWSKLVRKACVIVMPSIWHEEMPDKDGKYYGPLKEFCNRLGITDTPGWPAPGRLDGFAEVDYRSINQEIEAAGWILWLTGVFDGTDITLWDILPDQHREPNDRRYQPSGLALSLDVMVARK